jgi:hypothetical protein
VGNPKAAEAQIAWEFAALNESEIFSIWFSNADSDQPICMYELGRHLARWTEGHSKPFFVCIGVEPGYRREQDVRVQTSLLVPDFEIVDSLEAHVENIVRAVVSCDAAREKPIPNELKPIHRILKNHCAARKIEFDAQPPVCQGCEKRTLCKMFTEGRI